MYPHLVPTPNEQHNQNEFLGDLEDKKEVTISSDKSPP